MALLIKPDGEKQCVFPGNQVFSMDEMYDLLECSCVQVIYLPDGRIMWIDEDGKLKRHYINPIATVLLEMAGGSPGDYIAGSALITDSSEIN